MTLAAPAPNKAALRRAGQIARKRLAEDPSVHRLPVERAELYGVSQFITDAECDHLTAMIDRVAKPSTVFDPEYNAKFRTSYSGDVDVNDSFVRMIERRICDLIGLDPRWGENIQGQRYHPGQEFQGHYDWFDPSAHYWPGEAKRGGQRSWTVMAYLTDVAVGGHTEFPRLGISIAPQRGALIIWNNATPEGLANFDVIHAGQPVIAGCKYIFTKWFRAGNWE